MVAVQGALLCLQHMLACQYNWQMLLEQGIGYKSHSAGAASILAYQKLQGGWKGL